MISVLLIQKNAFSQELRKTYNLYWYDEVGKKFYSSGVALRNDTLFIDPTSVANIVAIKHEKDSIYECILLKEFRERVFRLSLVEKTIPNVKKDTTKKEIDPANIQKRRTTITKGKR